MIFYESELTLEVFPYRNDHAGVYVLIVYAEDNNSINAPNG